MFDTWREYAEYLTETLIPEEKNRQLVRTKIEKNAWKYPDREISEKFFREIINTILSNDWDFTKLTNFMTRPFTNNYFKYRHKGIIGKLTMSNPFIPISEKLELAEKNQI